MHHCVIIGVYLLVSSTKNIIIQRNLEEMFWNEQATGFWLCTLVAFELNNFRRFSINIQRMQSVYSRKVLSLYSTGRVVQSWTDVWTYLAHFSLVKHSISWGFPIGCVAFLSLLKPRYFCDPHTYYEWCYFVSRSSPSFFIKNSCFFIKNSCFFFTAKYTLWNWQRGSRRVKKNWKKLKLSLSIFLHHIIKWILVPWPTV